MPYLNDSPPLLSSLRWQTSLHHRMLQPTHSMRVPSESASQWLQPPKWDAAGTLTTHPQPFQILLGAVAAPEQRQMCRNATSVITGAAAAAGCGTLARRWRGIVYNLNFRFLRLSLKIQNYFLHSSSIVF